MSSDEGDSVPIRTGVKGAAAKRNLNAAKAAKNDEFYTQWADIKGEINPYLEYDPDVFCGKVILLPLGSTRTLPTVATLSAAAAARRAVVIAAARFGIGAVPAGKAGWFRRGSPSSNRSERQRPSATMCDQRDALATSRDQTGRRRII